MKAKPKQYKQALQVILGSQTIKAFVASPKEFKVIGIVRMGLEFGLLAMTASGNYVRVNGSQIEALSNAAVEAAIALARTTGRGESYADSRAHTQVVPPMVIVRKRRKISAELVDHSDEGGPVTMPSPMARHAPLHMPTHATL